MPSKKTPKSKSDPVSSETRLMRSPGSGGSFKYDPEKHSPKQAYSRTRKVPISKIKGKELEKFNRISAMSQKGHRERVARRDVFINAINFLVEEAGYSIREITCLLNLHPRGARWLPQMQSKLKEKLAPMPTEDELASGVAAPRSPTKVDILAAQTLVILHKQGVDLSSLDFGDLGQMMLKGEEVVPQR